MNLEQGTASGTRPHATLLDSPIEDVADLLAYVSAQAKELAVDAV